MGKSWAKVDSRAKKAGVGRCVKGRLKSHLLSWSVEDCHVENTVSVVQLLLLCRSNRLGFFSQMPVLTNSLTPLSWDTHMSDKIHLMGSEMLWGSDWWMNGQIDNDKIMWNVSLRGKVCINVTVGSPCAGQNLPSAWQHYLLLSQFMFLQLKTQLESKVSKPSLPWGNKYTINNAPWRSSSTIALKKLGKKSLPCPDQDTYVTSVIFVTIRRQQFLLSSYIILTKLIRLDI